MQPPNLDKFKKYFNRNKQSIQEIVREPTAGGSVFRRDKNSDVEILLIQDQQLRKRPVSTLIKHFPPLQTMESLLFGFLWAGWLLLSLSLITGWLFLDNLFAQHLVHKTLLSCVAWLVFGILLWGLHQLGWRGHKAIRWTITGFFLLMLAYFGSKLVREFILAI